MEHILHFSHRFVEVVFLISTLSLSQEDGLIVETWTWVMGNLMKWNSLFNCQACSQITSWIQKMRRRWNPSQKQDLGAKGRSWHHFYTNVDRCSLIVSLFASLGLVLLIDVLSTWNMSSVVGPWWKNVW